MFGVGRKNALHSARAIFLRKIGLWFRSQLKIESIFVLRVKWSRTSDVMKSLVVLSFAVLRRVLNVYRHLVVAP